MAVPLSGITLVYSMTFSQPHSVLIQAMLHADFYNHHVDACELIETHISWVILTGEYVYKIKKPVNLGFLDFSTLDKRKFFCDEELRLNKRLAPEIYLDVVKVIESQNNLVLNGDGKVIEYAVKMRQFQQYMQFDHLLSRNELTREMIEATAGLLAEFHQSISIAERETNYGNPEQVYQPVAENFSQIKERLFEKNTLKLVSTIETWSEKQFSQLKNIFLQRKKNNFIRECHGDLHLRNIAWYQNNPLAFDCLEFNENFRWIDVVSEIAFLIMDLDDHQQNIFARILLNKYLELTGDYSGCRVLQFYLVYRAMVRAKVDAIRASQEGIDKHEKIEALDECQSYLELAENYIQQHSPILIITRGKSASGKSTLTQILLEKLGAVRIRSDVERKRLFNIDNNQDTKTDANQGIYTSDSTAQTYAKLLELAGYVIDSGMPVIIDATFAKQEQRILFKELADKKKVNFFILEFTASDDELRKRIKARVNDISDADIGILEHQIKNWLPLDKEEEQYRLVVDTEKEFNLDALIKNIQTK